MDRFKCFLASTLAGVISLNSCAGPTDDDEPRPGEWIELAPLAAGPRQEMPAIELNGEIVTVGGFDSQSRSVATVEAYDPEANRWRRLADVPVPMNHANSAAVGGILFVVGFLNADLSPSGRVFAYDPAADAWRERTAMPAGTERGASGTAVVRERIYVVGGSRGRSVADASTYDPASDTWTAIPSMPTARDHLCAGVINGLVYAVGGRDGPNRPVLEVFDPTRGSWTSLSRIPTARGGIACATFAGRLFVFGGEGNASASSGVFDDTEAYDPDTNRWESLAPMRTPRHGIGAATLFTRIYIPGGASRQGFGAVASHDAYDPPLTR